MTTLKLRKWDSAQHIKTDEDMAAYLEVSCSVRLIFNTWLVSIAYLVPNSTNHFFRNCVLSYRNNRFNRCIDQHPSGIHQILRVNRLLDASHELQRYRVFVQVQGVGFQTAHAVFGADGAAKLHDRLIHQ